MPRSNSAPSSGSNPHPPEPPASETADPPAGGLRFVVERLDVGRLGAGGHRSVSAALAEQIRDAVRTGRLPPGTTMPASRTFAADLTVSRGVVVRAYEQLVAEGYLASRVGRGTTVAEVPGRALPADTGRHPSLIPANPGVPELAWFPRAEWRRAFDTALRELPDAELGYGDPRGHPRLRRALAAHLGRSRAMIVPPDRLVVTAGFAQGARLVAEALAVHGIDSVAVENPGSIGVVETLRSGGATTIAVPVDHDGLDVESLRSTGARAVLVTPAHQFPTGAVLGASRRGELLDWAIERDAVVVEDDYDAEYRYDRSAVGSLQGLAPDHVVHGGSVSKTLAPAVRLGWLVAPAWLTAALVEAKYRSDIAAPVLDQVALAAFIEGGGLDRHIRRTSSRYAARRRALLAAVAHHLPAWHTTGVAAGLHAVVVPADGSAPGIDRSVVDAMAAAAAPLHAVGLHRYDHGGHGTAPGVVVGYGSATPARIERGIAAMAAAVTGRAPHSRESH